MSFVEARVQERGPQSATVRVYLTSPQSASPKVNIEVIDAAPINPDTHGRHEVVIDAEAWRALNRLVEAMLKRDEVPF